MNKLETNVTLATPSVFVILTHSIGKEVSVNYTRQKSTVESFSYRCFHVSCFPCYWLANKRRHNVSLFLLVWSNACSHWLFLVT